MWNVYIQNDKLQNGVTAMPGDHMSENKKNVTLFARRWRRHKTWIWSVYNKGFVWSTITPWIYKYSEAFGMRKQGSTSATLP